ncbi:MAG: hypothetical protein M1819_006512 [Sarea resinae]|nr:MAG: hypothetical protein M1819_006512 [Sarea resinae]
MSELSFAKQFLGTLDSRPIKTASDYAEDPRHYPAQRAYTLPKLARPMHKRQKLVAPGSSRSVTIHLKSLRNPPLNLTLTSQPLSTSVHELKAHVAEATKAPPHKVKLLHNKKPCADIRTVREVLGLDDETAAVEGPVEFSVMVIGGATASSPATPAPSSPGISTPSGVGAGVGSPRIATPVMETAHSAADVKTDADPMDIDPKVPSHSPASEVPVAQGPHGTTVLASEPFWDDLKGFLLQRLRDEAEGQEVFEVFRDAWSRHKST